MKRTLSALAAALTLLALGCTSKSPTPASPGSPADTYQWKPYQNPNWQEVRTTRPPDAAEMDALEAALQKDPANAKAAYQLGAAYEQAGQVEKAQSIYTQALQQTPGNLDLKRALAALINDFTMDGTPDRVAIEGPFFYFYDGTKPDWILQYQPWQGETNLKAEVVDLGGTRPAVVVSSPKGIGVEVQRPDGGFTGVMGGESAVYDPVNRQLVIQRPAQVGPEPAPPVGYLRVATTPDGQPTPVLSTTPYAKP